MVMATTSEYLGSHGLRLKLDKIFTVQDEHGRRAETRTFFSIPFDLVLEPIKEQLLELYEWKPGKKGSPPFPPEAMFKAIIYAKLNKNMSDRELERHLLRHPRVMEALGFESVPSHQTFSLFKRERLTVKLLERTFNRFRDHLVDAGRIDYSSLTVDSAPIRAFANLPKANQAIRLKDALARALMEDPIYRALAADVVSALDYKRSLPKHVQKRKCCLNLLMLYELGGFLSHSKVSKYLGKEEHGSLLGAVTGTNSLPSDPTLSRFKRELRAARDSDAFRKLSAYLERFFSEFSEPYEPSNDLLFPGLFAVLQDSCSLTDPDARLGYCAAKKQVFLGYRVQLLIDDKKNSR